MKTFFKSLYEYNNYCNAKLAQSFITNHHIALSESVKIFNHIINAHQIWNSRIQGTPKVFGVWDLHNPIDYDMLIKANLDNTNAILDIFPLTDSIQYSNGKGQNIKKKVSDVLFHIINHSTYHRGQIAIDFRKNGINPIATDYIFYTP